jgi:rSAM/selenodomain-associated transferase 1
MKPVQRFSSAALLCSLCVLAWCMHDGTELVLPIFVLCVGLLYAAVLHARAEDPPPLLVPCVVVSGILLRFVFAHIPSVDGFALTKHMMPLTNSFLLPEAGSLDIEALRQFARLTAVIDCMTLLLLPALLRHWRKPAIFLALYAWNPLVLVFGITAIRFSTMSAVLLLAAALLSIDRSPRYNALAYLLFGGAVIMCPLLIVLYPFIGRSTRLTERACVVLMPIACWSLLKPQLLYLRQMFFTHEVMPGALPSLFLTCCEDWFIYGGHFVIAVAATAAIWGWIYLWIWLLKQDTPGESLGMVMVLMLVCVPQFYLWMVLPLMLLMLHTPTLARLLLIATCGIAYWSDVIEPGEFTPIVVIWFPVGAMALFEMRRRIPFGAARRPPVQSLDIVIPVLNEEENIEAHLESLQDAIDATNSYLGKDVPAISVRVVDGGSTDGTESVVRKFSAQFMQSPGGGRGGQLADGIDNGTGDLILMLHADSIVRSGALVAMLDSFRDHPELEWGVLGHGYYGGLPQPRMTRFSNDMRFLYGGIAFGDQGIFVRRSCLDDVGGMPRLPLMEDMELSLRLNRCPSRLKVGDNLQLSTRAWERNKKGSYLLKVLRIGTAYLFRRRCDVEPEKPAPVPDVPRPKAPVLCLYAKPPVPGKTKSRLAADIGDEAAAALARAMLVDNCRLLSQVPGAKLQLWHPPGCTVADFADLVPDGFTFHEQQGADLGQRMAFTIQSQLNDSGRPVIIVGSDCVTHLPEAIEAAAKALASHDVVLRPAEDGGYVLIGQSSYTPAMFDDIDWGTDTVYADSRTKLDDSGCNWTALDETFDVDLVSDLDLVREAVTLESHPAVSEWLKVTEAR